MDVRLEETVYFDFQTSSADGAKSDADSLPTAEVFENATDTTVVALTVTKRTGKTGNYRVPVPCTTANGFEVGKSYNVSATATVGGVTAGAVIGRFMVRPAAAVANVTQVNGEDAEPGVIDCNVVTVATDAIDAASVKADAVTKIQAGLGSPMQAGAHVQLATSQDQYAPAKAGDAMTLADGAITDAKITFPAESAGRPTTFLAAVRRLWEWTVNKRIRTRSTGAVVLRNATDSATLETQTQSTTGGTGSEVDTQTKGA